MDGGVLLGSFAGVIVGLGLVITALIPRATVPAAPGGAWQRRWMPVLVAGVVVLVIGAGLFVWFVVGALTMEPAVAL